MATDRSNVAALLPSMRRLLEHAASSVTPTSKDSFAVRIRVIALASRRLRSV
jgi:hypothetical protein